MTEPHEPGDMVERVARAIWRSLTTDVENDVRANEVTPDELRKLAQAALAASGADRMREALEEAIAVFEGMCDDEIEEELLPRLRQALATAALSAMSPAGEAEQRGYDRAIAEVVAFLRAQADWLAGCDWEEARAYLDVATAIEAGEHKP